MKKVASGYRFQVRQEYSKWVNRLWDEKPQRYSRALLETLALIAYKQPITRGDIEEVRGVAVSTNIMRTLLERDWIRVVGHRDIPGRPATYATTKNFLDYFNLSHLDELPDLSEVDDLGKVNEELNFSEVVGDINELEIEKGENLTSMTLDAEEALERVNAEAEIIENTIIDVRSEATNDKSGKATPLDRILIMAPDKSNPTPFIDNSNIPWNPISDIPE